VLTIAVSVALFCGSSAQTTADDGLEFFEKRVRPQLVTHCYGCHSAQAKEIKGELRLDVKNGWQLGGESGRPAIVPGEPDKSLLIRVVRHDDDVSAMPPNQPKLSDQIIADLTSWVQIGAPDPRDNAVERQDEPTEWEAVYQSRLDWWSLRPVEPDSSQIAVPAVQHSDWVYTDVDRFILAKLQEKSLLPAPEADRRTLLRRLSFALTGLPPTPVITERFALDASPGSYDLLVDVLLDSPHFGERWARHWMDVVHYSDTHGYEWDVPAKNAWRYRDYLIRSLNTDVPYRQLVLEQLAGDLLPFDEARIDPATGMNESLIGPMALRLGERRHGDNAAAEGISQESVAIMIDTIGKAFLGTTLACAQCHDHKLDAVEQRDYYALAGVLMSTRYSARTLDAVDPNGAVIEELRQIKTALRTELAQLWTDALRLGERDGVVEKIRALSAGEEPSTAFPTSLAEFWKRSLSSPVTAAEFTPERSRRVTANRKNLSLLADFTREDGANGWRWDGFGMQHGLARAGEITVSDQRDDSVMQLLPAGRFSHVWSQRLAGSLQSPQLDPQSPITFSVQMVAGQFSSQSFIVDRALHSERLKFMDQPTLGWSAFTAGNFDSLEGTPDRSARLVYLEFATKALNNYFPPRVNYGGITEEECADPRSWFGVTRVYQHSAGQTPHDELDRFVPLFEELNEEKEWAYRLAKLLRAAVERWSTGACTSEDVRLVNDALQLKLLPNDLTASPTMTRLVEEYRAVEKRLLPDRTIGSAADWNEGRNERIGIRGSYTELGDEVKRSAPRFLVSHHRDSAPSISATSSSGRLELARTIVDDRNPLTARVYVNRVWHYLFGEGLVRTPDDFGHLGELPTHSELLDYLAARFMRDGWSTKRLIKLLVTSAVWRQSSIVDSKAIAIDPENRLWHYRPMRRLEAEAVRDAMLAVSGRLDRGLYGLPVEPYRAAEDTSKRLLQGPLDGDGRRSLYIEMTLMEPPRFLALFNQPLPKQTVGRRDITNVPDQALALLNDPFVIAMSKHWSQRLVRDGATSPKQRARWMLAAALARPPSAEETSRLVKLVRRTARLRESTGEALLNCQPAWQDAAHAIFNLKEFIYVP
jgi:cytochrome c553